MQIHGLDPTAISALLMFLIDMQDTGSIMVSLYYSSSLGAAINLGYCLGVFASGRRMAIATGLMQTYKIRKASESNENQPHAEISCNVSNPFDTPKPLAMNYPILMQATECQSCNPGDSCGSCTDSHAISISSVTVI